MVEINFDRKSIRNREIRVKTGRFTCFLVLNRPLGSHHDDYYEIDAHHDDDGSYGGSNQGSSYGGKPKRGTILL